MAKNKDWIGKIAVFALDLGLCAQAWSFLCRLSLSEATSFTDWWNNHADEDDQALVLETLVEFRVNAGYVIPPFPNQCGCCDVSDLEELLYWYRSVGHETATISQVFDPPYIKGVTD